MIRRGTRLTGTAVKDLAVRDRNGLRAVPQEMPEAGMSEAPGIGNGERTAGTYGLPFRLSSARW
jgi:hypothetical protein